MKKGTVCICGTIHHRNDAVLKLSGAYTIIGYLEFPQIYKLEFFDYKHVYSYDKCYMYDPEYYVITYKEQALIDRALIELQNAGINNNSIVIYNQFAETTNLDTLTRYGKENEKFENIVLGMSHAKSDIMLSEFYPNSFSFAAPSMDLFCHYETLQYIADKYPDKVSEIKRIFIELPYYIFNYDLSKFRQFFVTKISYFYRFGSYHNFDDENIIEQYHIFVKLYQDLNFSQGYISEDNPEVNRDSYKFRIKHWIYHLADMGKVIFIHDKVWEKEFVQTKSENIMLWNNILECIKTKFNNPRVYIIVAPFNPLFIKSHKDYINNSKKVFYEVIETKCSSYEVVDLFNSMPSLNCFLDHCHLNKRSAKIWTKYLCDNIDNRERKEK